MAFQFSQLHAGCHCVTQQLVLLNLVCCVWASIESLEPATLQNHDSTMSRVDQLGDATGTSSSLVKIIGPSIGMSNNTWTFGLDCQDVPGLRRPSRACLPASAPCFRAVHDGLIPRTDALALARKLESESGDISNLPEVAYVVDVLMAAFTSRHSVGRLRLTCAYYLKGNFNGGELHSDLQKDQGSLYSALVYFNHAFPDDGGATVFVDRIEGGYERGYSMTAAWTPESRVTEGIYVFPSVGRVVLFSGGLENMHIGLHAVREEAEPRKVLAIWYDCEEQGHFDL